MTINNTATIFDIQRFALHDGPGIRTVIFFKGCGLQCQWCCNPESQSSKPQLAFLSHKCTQCMQCISYCNQNVLSNENNLLKIDFSKCTSCGDCIDHCPYDALKIYGWVASVDDLMDIISKDIDYFENSGGGITLSGGEVMGHSQFATELLKTCKRIGIHTCIETSGFGTLNEFKTIAKYVDLFIIDYKATGEEMHKNLTMVSNKLCIQNLDFLYRNGHQILIRIPLIPSKNLNKTHLDGIVTLSKKYPNIRGIEIMSYHDFGKGKYEDIGKTYKIQVPTSSKEDKKKWISELRELGAINILDEY